MESQMFFQFLEGQLTIREDDFERLYFYECVMAKKNRSSMAFQKRETPFLEDK